MKTQKAIETPNAEEAAKHFASFLKSLGLDLSDPNLKNTPTRVTKMYLEELFVGLTNEPPVITTFDLSDNSEEISKELIISGPIRIRSTCSHHFMPIVGKCFVAVLADASKLPGLSKYARVAHHYASRPQLQEQLTQQIANHLTVRLGIKHCGVVIKAEHFCMSHRGVKEHDANMITSSLMGDFKKAGPLRQEFLSLIQKDL